jgi:hypothetical protein
MATKITQLNRTNSDQVQAALMKAAEVVGKKFGLEVKAWGYTYEDTHTTFKIRAIVPGAAEERGAAAFKASVGKEFGHGLPASALGQTFKDGKHSYTIVGYEPYKKFSIQTTREDGASIGMTVDYAKKLISK